MYGMGLGVGRIGHRVECHDRDPELLRVQERSGESFHIVHRHADAVGLRRNGRVELLDQLIHVALLLGIDVDDLDVEGLRGVVHAIDERLPVWIARTTVGDEIEGVLRF